MTEPYELADVQAMHTKDPTLLVPHLQDLTAIKSGDYVRLLFVYPPCGARCSQERMWVRVEHHDRRSGVIIGILTSDPVCIDWETLRWGDQITCHEVNVLHINHQTPPRCLN